jgi:hypothetical protein
MRHPWRRDIREARPAGELFTVDDHRPGALKDLVELPFDLVVVLAYLEALSNQYDMAAEGALRVCARYQVF